MSEICFLRFDIFMTRHQIATCVLLLLLAGLVLPNGADAQPTEPSLPPGLGGEASPEAASGTGQPGGGPSLPPGLGKESSSPGLSPGLEGGDSGPSLPLGLERKAGPGETGTGLDDRKGAEEKSLLSDLPFQVGGFWEARGGLRTDDDPYQKEVSIGESRLQVEIQKYWSSSSFDLTVDFLYDPVVGEYDVDLEEGQGLIDLRELKYTFTPVSFMDVRIGRQVLTWGTGDLIFLNDLFPKDWRSFFIGRDVDYLKAPSDAVKVSIFGSSLQLPFSLDIVYTPRFDPDRFIEGRRISYWNPLLGRRAGRNHVLETGTPDDWFEDDELALRLYRNISGYELAFYAYRGFWKSPAGIAPASGRFLHPELSVYGTSLEGSIGPGIGNVEFAWYESKDDEDGDNPFIDNSQLRFLVGYEQEAGRNFTVAGQYYLEHLLDYDAYRRSLPAGQNEKDEDRHVLTLRLTKQLLMQNLELSLFAFYSPSDEDAYLRPRMSYDINDHWLIETGANIFLGEEDHTFFSQFENNTNIYLGLRYSF